MRHAASLLICLFLGCSTAQKKAAPVSDWDQALRRLSQAVTRLPAAYDWTTTSSAQLASTGHKTRIARLTELKRALTELTDRELTRRQRLRLATLSRRIQLSLDRGVCHQEWWSVNPLTGPQVFLALYALDAQTHPDESHQKLAMIYRSSGFVIDAHIRTLRVGLSHNYVATKFNISRTIEQLDYFLSIEPTASVFGRSIASLTATDAQKQALIEVVAQTVYPALNRYRDFLAKELFAHGRTDAGIRSLPQGSVCYEKLANFHAGQAVDVKSLHRRGVREMRRISQKIEAIVQEIDGGNAEAFLAQLSERGARDEGQENTVFDALARATNRGVTRMLGAVSDRAPRTPVFRKMPKWWALSSPSFGYRPLPGHGRPVIFIHDDNLALYRVPSVALSAGEMGHHLAFSLIEPVGGTAHFSLRPTDGVTDGWSQYVLTLGVEMNAYETPEELLGLLTAQAWHLARMIVDTGIHAYDWTRERAIDYLSLNTAYDPDDVVKEVDAIIAHPGSALGGPFARMAFQSLRIRVSEHLGDGFDLRAFHSQLLGHGPIPMDVLALEIDDWLGQPPSSP